MKVFERMKKEIKTTDECNAERYQVHPKLNKWFDYIWISVMVGCGTLIAVLAPIAYVIHEMTLPQVIASLAGSALALTFGVWGLRYRKKIIKLAFPNGDGINKIGE